MLKTKSCFFGHWWIDSENLDVDLNDPFLKTIHLVNQPYTEILRICKNLTRSIRLNIPVGAFTNLEVVQVLIENPFIEDISLHYSVDVTLVKQQWLLLSKLKSLHLRCIIPNNFDITTLTNLTNLSVSSFRNFVGFLCYVCSFIAYMILK